MESDSKSTLREMKLHEQAVKDHDDLVKMHKTKEEEKALRGAYSALKGGRVQAFRAMGLLAEYLEWKTMAEAIDNKDYLNIPGVTSVDEYLDFLGLARRSAFYNLKIARTLTPDEVQLFALIGLTRKDLLGIASLPDEQRLKIKEGKIINLENADREEIRSIIEDLVAESRDKDRILQDKQKMLNRAHEREDKLDIELRETKEQLKKSHTDIYGDLFVTLDPIDQQAMKELHYAHDQVWLALTAISAIDKEKTKADILVFAVSLCQHLRDIAIEKMAEIGEVRPDLPNEIDSQYWDSILPFNAKTKQDRSQA